MGYERGESAMKKVTFNSMICIILVIAIVGVVDWANKNKEKQNEEIYNDGIEQMDLDSIYLGESNVQVDFSEIIIGNEKETRKLIVLEQEATAKVQLSKSLIDKINVELLKTTQEVSYTGKGYFVIDLDKMTKENIVEDKDKKTITIMIGHAYLQTIEIDPNEVKIGEVQKGVLGKGVIELTISDYNTIEKNLKKDMTDKLRTDENGQKADAIALKMVKEVYEPIIKAIDSRYSVYVEFE